MTTTKKRGGAQPGSGRPRSGKVKLTVHVLPETRAALGAKPGEAIDRLIKDAEAS
jgi:hypothetical protein